MKNLFSNFNRLLILTCTLLTMSVNVWGVTTYQHVFSTKPSTGNNVTLSGVTWNITATSLGNYNSGNYKGVQFGTSKATGSITLTSSSAWSYDTNKTKITEVRLWLNSGTANTVTASVTIGGNVATSDGTTVGKNSSASAWNNGTSKITFTPASTANTGVIVVTATTGSNKVAGYICGLEIDCEVACTEPTVLTDNGACSTNTDYSLTENCFTSDNTSTPVFTCTSDNASSCTINGSTFRASAAGTYTIKGTQEADGTYCAVDESFNVDVSAPTSTDYYFRGGHNSWGATKMTKHESGYYSYYGPVSGDQRFKITTGDNWDPQYSHTYLSSGFEGTNITNMGHWDNDGNCGIYDANNYYILVYHPNTDRNSDSNIKICASSELPLYTAGGNTVYFDNSTTQWSTLNFRIGRVTHNNAPEMTKVSGTANLYKVEVAKYDNYVAFAPANNCGWTGSNSIYLNPSDGNRFTGITEYQKYTVDGDFTLQPTTGNTKDGVTYWAVNKTSGMLSHTATITAPSNGTITVAYTDVDNSAKTFTSGGKTLAHTCNLTITASPAAGYKCTGLTVNGSDFTSGNTHVLSADATIAATFVACTVTAQSNNTELGTVSGTTTITASPKSCVGYANTAYTVTGGSATVSQEGNTFTVSNYTTDVTVTINFAALAVDTYVDNLHSNADIIKCGSYNAPSLDDATKQTTGACDAVHYHFAGWSTTTSTTGVGSTSQVTGFFAGGTAKTASGTTYYAVWAKELE